MRRSHPLRLLGLLVAVLLFAWLATAASRHDLDPDLGGDLALFDGALFAFALLPRRAFQADGYPWHAWWVAVMTVAAMVVRTLILSVIGGMDGEGFHPARLAVLLPLLAFIGFGWMLLRRRGGPEPTDGYLLGCAGFAALLAAAIFGAF